MSMSMVAGSWSPRFDRSYGQAGPAEAARTEQRRAVSMEDGKDDDSVRRNDDAPGRRNPLVNALMQALKGLMAPSAAPAAAPATAAAPTEPAATVTTAPVEATAAAAETAPAADASATTTATSTPTDKAGELKDAAYAFAHELFSALRSVREDSGRDRSDGDRDGGRGHGHRHHAAHHHGHRHGGRGDNNYADLAQGLRTLAARIDSPATAATPPVNTTPPAATSPAPLAVDSATSPATEFTPPVTDTPDTPAAAAGVGPTTGVSVDIQINIQIKFSSSTTTTAPAPAEDSPLLAAFKRLMDQLNPQAAGGAEAANAASPEEKLKSFLLGIADALRGNGESAASRPAIGSLIDIAA